MDDATAKAENLPQPGASGQGDSEAAVRPVRRRLPDERRAITHHFSVGGHEGYITVGLYEDGSPGELFIKMSKEGSAGPAGTNPCK